MDNFHDMVALNEVNNILKSKTIRDMMEKEGYTFNDILTSQQLEVLKRKPILSGEELFYLPDTKSPHIIDGFLYEDDVLVILAKEKVGKSILVSQMCCAITSGTPFLDQYETCEPSTVLYIQAEGSRTDFIDRLKRMTHTVKWNSKNFYHMFPPSLALNTDKEFDKLALEIETAGICPKVIVLDPLYMAMKGSLKDDDVARAFCGNIRSLQDRFKCAVIVVHHENRGIRDNFGNKLDVGDDSIYGSFVWKAFPSHVIRLSKLKDGSRKLTCSTQRSSNIVEKVNLKLHGKNESVPLMFEVSDVKVPASDVTVFTFIKNSGDKGTHAREVVAGTGLSESNVRSSFSNLLKRGEIEKVNEGGCPVLYRAKIGDK